MMSSTLEDSELKCSCGLPAKMRVSRTSRNPFRLFYNCPKGFDQCEFFWWSDEPSPTGDRHIDELNLIRNECIRLQERIDNLREEHDESRIQWNEEKTELTSQLLNVRTELDDMKKKIKVANESDLMPPLDKISIADKEADDAVVIHTAEQ